MALAEATIGSCSQALTISEAVHPMLYSSDEYLERVTVWPELFEREAGRIRSALGPRALRIEHVGSTSVPGLCAKPIIDTLLTVPEAGDEASCIPALEAAGYSLLRTHPSDRDLYAAPSEGWPSASGDTCSTPPRPRRR